MVSWPWKLVCRMILRIKMVWQASQLNFPATLTVATPGALPAVCSSEHPNLGGRQWTLLLRARGLMSRVLMELGSPYTHTHLSTSQFAPVWRKEISRYLLGGLLYPIFPLSHYSVPWVARARNFIVWLFIFSIKVWHCTFKLIQYRTLKEFKPILGLWSEGVCETRHWLIQHSSCCGLHHPCIQTISYRFGGRKMNKQSNKQKGPGT